MWHKKENQMKPLCFGAPADMGTRGPAQTGCSAAIFLYKVALLLHGVIPN
jgi:hypothetical protein